MSSKYPKKITTAWITEQLEKGDFPNMYPEEDFLSEHYKIVDEYRTEIKLYKGNCYRELNTYFKTGEVIMQGGCGIEELDQVAKKAGKKGLTAEEKVELVAQRIEELYDKVKPLPHDILVYRGVKRGTVGQNLFTGNCIKTRLYDLDMHRFCEDPDMEDIKLYEDRKQGGDPRPYVAETLGLVSTSTKIGTALGFADKDGDYDTVMALRLPAGTKFIMPVDSSGYDYEYEFILFPKHNTYVLNNVVDTKISAYSGEKTPVYVGSFCNDLNKYRKSEPKLRELRVKILKPGDWLSAQQKDRPLLTVETGKCSNADCHSYLHFCNPETGKCLGDKPETAVTIQDWWREKNKKGKCTKKKVDKCVDKNLACDPNTGKCLKSTDLQEYWNYSSLITARVLNWVNPEMIIAQQKPRYKCTKDKIKKCAENEGKLCHPFSNDPPLPPTPSHPLPIHTPSYECAGYSEEKVWYYNNALPNSEMKDLVPTGNCTEAKIKDCTYWGNQFCDPDTGTCKSVSESNEDAWNKMLAAQTDEAKAEWKKKKEQEAAEKEKKKQEKKQKIIDNQKPRYKCTAEKIEQCAEQGKLCHPVHKYQDCKDTYNDDDFDEDLFYVNTVVDKTDLTEMDEYGKCQDQKIQQCAEWKEFCDPDIGMCLEFNTTNKTQVEAFHKELEKQKKAGKKKKVLMSDYLKMKVTELKAELKKRGLKVSGNKAELIDRLAKDDAAKKK